MRMSFFKHTETDLGSKGRAKIACEELPKKITQEAGWRMKAVWYRVLETARSLCMGYGIFRTGTLYRTIRLEEKGTIQGEGMPFEVVFTSESKTINPSLMSCFKCGFIFLVDSLVVNLLKFLPMIL